MIVRVWDGRARDWRLEPVIFSRRASRSSSFAKRTAFQKGGPRHPNWVVSRKDPSNQTAHLERGLATPRFGWVRDLRGPRGDKPRTRPLSYYVGFTFYPYRSLCSTVYSLDVELT